MREKTWHPWPGCECPDCGAGTEVYTDADALEGWATDADQLRCSDSECPRHTRHLGQVIVYDEDDVSDSFEVWPVGDDDKPFEPKSAVS